MAIAFDASCSSFRSFFSATSLDAPLSITVAADATVVVFVASDTFSSGQTYTVSDGTNTFTEITSRGYDTSSQNKVAMHSFKYTGSAGTKSITITSNTATSGRAFAASWTGLAAYAAADTPVTNTGNSTTPTTGSTATLSNANSLVVVAFSGNLTTWTGGNVNPPNTGYTTVYSNSTNTNTPVSFAYKIVSATTAVSSDMGTLSNAADNWGAILGVIPQSSASAKSPILQLVA